MCFKSWQGRVEDILEAIGNLQTFVRGMTFEEFASDRKTMSASAYEIGIIGEAARCIPDEVQRRYPQVPWSKMRSIRNIVVHEYFRVDPVILWQTIRQNLPPLVATLQKMLEEN